MKIHIDLDCFFVSAERTLNPALKNRPVAVGGRGDRVIFSTQNTQQAVSLSNTGAFVPSIIQAQKRCDDIYDRSYFIDPDGRVRGILTTASYEARALGIKTPMPIAQALQLCPNLIVLSPTFTLYHELSTRLRTFLEARIPLIEQFSIDEFFGDLHGWVAPHEVPHFIHALKEEIAATFDLPSSIGAAPSKWTAKLATSYAKPFGTHTVLEVLPFVQDMPIGAFPGIGRQLQKRFLSMQFHTLGDILRAKSYFQAQTPSMQQLYKRIAGTDAEAVKPPKMRKSIGVARTFDPILSRKEIQRRLTILSRHLAFTIMQAGVNPTHFHLHLRYEFKANTQGHIHSNRLFTERRLKTVLLELFMRIDTYPTLALIALSISADGFLHQTKKALDLFYIQSDQKERTLWLSTVPMRKKYGLDILRWGNELLA